MKFFTKPVPLWSHFAVAGVVLLVIATLAGGIAVGILTPPWVASAIGPHSVVKNDQVVTSIEKKEQTVLLELAAEGVSEVKGVPPAFLADFPALRKARYMIYRMKVKLGVDAVVVNPTGDHKFLVQVPAFVWIGSDDFDVYQVIGNDGILSAFTEQTSVTEQQNSIIDDKLKAKYLDGNEKTLREQTEYYFTKLATAIDPDAELTFDYAE